MGIVSKLTIVYRVINIPLSAIGTIGKGDDADHQPTTKIIYDEYSTINQQTSENPSFFMLTTTTKKHHLFPSSSSFQKDHPCSIIITISILRKKVNNNNNNLCSPQQYPRPFEINKHSE